jgi:hypothetical protein
MGTHWELKRNIVRWEPGKKWEKKNPPRTPLPKT